MNSLDLLDKVVSGATWPVPTREWASTAREWVGLTRSRRRGVVSDIQTVAPGVVEVKVKVGRGWPGHHAGQFVNLSVEIDGVLHTRSYSLTAPARRGATGAPTLSFVVFAVASGTVSNYIVEHARVGDRVGIDGPYGDFCLDSVAAERPVVLIGGGSGVTPVLGMLRELRALHDSLAPARRAARDVVALVFQPEAATAAFASELRSLAGESVRVELISTRGPGGAHVRDVIENLCRDWRARDVFVCGPGRLIADVEDLWLDAAAAVHVESFRPRMVAVADTTQDSIVEFSRSGVVVQARPGETLLEAAENAGLAPAAGCRSGVCFTCSAPLTCGEVVDVRSGRRASAGGHVQICVSRPTGAAVVEL